MSEYSCEYCGSGLYDGSWCGCCANGLWEEKEELTEERDRYIGKLEQWKGIKRAWSARKCGPIRMTIWGPLEGRPGWLVKANVGGPKRGICAYSSPQSRIGDAIEEACGKLIADIERDGR